MLNSYEVLHSWAGSRHKFHAVSILSYKRNITKLKKIRNVLRRLPIRNLQTISSSSSWFPFNSLSHISLLIESLQILPDLPTLSSPWWPVYVFLHVLCPSFAYVNTQSSCFVFISSVLFWIWRGSTVPAASRTSDSTVLYFACLRALNLSLSCFF